jgi:histidinol-phosphate aminotransferase
MKIKALRKAVHNVNPYVPGKTIEEVKRDYNLQRVIKLGSNENTYGPFPNAIQAMEEAVKNLNTYPDTSFNEIKDIIAAKYNIDSSYISIAHGSGGILQTIAQTFIEQGDEILLPLETYKLYSEISKLMGGIIKEVPLNKDYTIDLDEIQKKITTSTKLIWLCNPNNPTGTIFDLDAYKRLINNLPDHTWLILDEAYAEFASKHLLPNSIEDIKKGKNIIAVRTFSKAYGLAGARLGYSISSPKMTSVLETVSEPFNANKVALAGATATLTKDEKYYRECMKAIVKERQFLTDSLKEMGFQVVKGYTNFVFFNMPYNAAKISQKLLEKGIIVRPCTGWNYPNAIRVTIGTSEDNKEFIRALKEVTS